MPSNRYIIFSANYLPSFGGVERFTNGLARQLARMGKRVTIVTNNVYDLADTEQEDENVSIVRLPCHSLINGRLPIPRINKRFHELWEGLDAQDCCGILINTRFYFHSLLALRFAKKAGITPVLLEHGSAYLTFGNAILDIAVRLYEHIITLLDKRYPFDCYAISQKSAEWVKTFNIEPHGVISNAIDAQEYRSDASKRDYRAEYKIPSSHLLVSFSGRLAPEKGVRALINAFKTLESDPVHLLIAGDGPLMSYVCHQSADNIVPLGALNREDVAALMLQSDIFCLPTRSEGFSTSLLEACVCEAAPIVTNVGGVQELIPSSEFGTILEDATSSCIAAAVHKAINNPEGLRKQGVLCRKRAEANFSWENTATRFIDACLAANPIH